MTSPTSFQFTPRRPRLLAGMAVVGLLIAGLATSASTPVEAASPKKTICHRTHSTTNPYRRITVSQSAVQNNRHGGHDAGAGNPDVYDSTFLYEPNNKTWGDIIPGATDGGDEFNGTAQIAMNWTAEGRNIFFGASCASMTASEFYTNEVDAGVPVADIIDDLNEQRANEDVAALAVLGGTFTEGNIAEAQTAVTVATDPATEVEQTTATVNGHLSVGETSTVTEYLWGTDPTLTTFSTAAASATPVTGAVDVPVDLTGLTPGTTYWFRVTGTTNTGTELEGVLYGSILSFSTPAGAPTTTTTTLAPEATTPTTAAPTTAAPTTAAPTTAAPTTAAPTTAAPTTAAPTTAAPTTAAPTTAAPTTAAPTTDDSNAVLPSTGNSTNGTTTVALLLLGTGTLLLIRRRTTR